MKRFARIALILAVALPLTAQAHKVWLLPSATVLSDNGWITVDAAVSNDLFYFNHVPLKLDNLSITAPDGSKLSPANAHTGQYRSVFDLELTQKGTYRLANAGNYLFATWEENAERRRWRGAPEAFAKEVPQNADKLEVSQALTRVETFVTNGAPNDTALKATGVGLELVPVTHPNDLFAGEAAQFRLQLDGKPAANLKIVAIPGGTRYRDGQDEQSLTTDAEGRFDITWPQAGMYWLEAVVEDGNASLPQASKRRASYVATLEVLPQ